MDGHVASHRSRRTGGVGSPPPPGLAGPPPGGGGIPALPRWARAEEHLRMSRREPSPRVRGIGGGFFGLHPARGVGGGASPTRGLPMLGSATSAAAASPDRPTRGPGPPPHPPRT